MDRLVEKEGSRKAEIIPVVLMNGQPLLHDELSVR
jgi:hypothetical protein